MMFAISYFSVEIAELHSYLNSDQGSVIFTVFLITLKSHQSIFVQNI